MTREQKILLGVIGGIVVIGLAVLLGYMTTGGPEEERARVTVEPRGTAPEREMPSDQRVEPQGGGPTPGVSPVPSPRTEPEAAQSQPKPAPEKQPIRETDSAAFTPSKQMPTMMEFGADWCGYCQQMKPVMREVRDDYEGKIKIINVDVDKNKQAAEKYNITAIPTQIFFDKNGKQVFRHEGVYTKDEIDSQLEKMGVES